MRFLIILLLTGCTNLDRLIVIQSEAGGAVKLITGQAKACSLRVTPGIALQSVSFNPSTGACKVELQPQE